MDKKINLSQLVDIFVQTSGLNKNLSEQFVRSFFDIISENVLKGETVKIKGFGTFKLVQMDSRESINVNTGERIIIKGHNKISFLPEATLRDGINKPFSAFETIELNDHQVDVLENKSECVNITESDKDNNVSKIIASTEEPNVSTGEIIVEPEKNNQIKPLSTNHVKNEIKRSSKKHVGLKIALYSTSSLLAILLAAYILWPLNLLKFLRDTDVFHSGKQVAAVPSVDNIDNQSSDESFDYVLDDSIDNVIEIENGRKEVVDESAITVNVNTTNKPFTLIESDEKKDLSLFSISDTINYRMKQTKVEHIIQSGETLTIISLKYYGTKKLWPYIAAYNKLKNFNTLTPGSKILVPELENK